MPKKMPSKIQADPTPHPDESLGEYLRRLRLIRGMDLGVVSAQTPQEPSQHVSQSYLSQLELGRQFHPSPEKLVSLAHALDVPEAWILEKAGYASGESGELDSESRKLALRAAELTDEDRTVLNSIIDGLLNLRRRQSKK